MLEQTMLLMIFVRTINAANDIKCVEMEEMNNPYEWDCPSPSYF